MDSEDKKKFKIQCQMISKLCINRKKQNFDALKQWDQIRAHKLMTHRRVSDLIDDALQSRIAESEEFLRIVMQFLADIQAQQKKYQIQNVTNPESKLQTNSIARNIHIATSECLTRVYKATQNFKSFKKVKSVLEESVKRIEKMLTQSERDIMEIRTKIQLIAVQIQNENGQTIEKCDQLVNVFNKEKMVKMTQTSFDLFNLQKQFLQQTIVQTKTQQSFGEAVVELLNCVERYEKLKLDLVRQVLENYLNSRQDKRNDSVKSFLDILEKRTESQIFNKFYSTEQFLTREVIREINKAQCREDSFKVDLNTIISFLTKINYHPFDSRNLILKEYKTYVRNQDEDELQNAYLIITVDGFLHIYIYQTQFELVESQPEYSLKMNNSIDIQREAEINISITIKKWQFIQLSENAGKYLKIAFLNEDQREQFLQFVAKIV